MIKIIFFMTLILSFFIKSCYSTQNCTDLQNIQTNNSTFVLTLTNNIDCTSLNFISVGTSSISDQFKGTIAGEGYSIINLTISSSNDPNYAGMIAFGNGKKIMNINFINLKIVSNRQNVGEISGICYNCNFTNINFTTSSSSIFNYFESSNTNGRVGSFSGQFYNSFLTNCIIQNTIVNGSGSSSSSSGGFIGNIQSSSTIINCHNLGISSNPNSIIVFGYQFVGGIIGYSENSNIYKSGVYQGKIKAKPILWRNFRKK